MTNFSASFCSRWRTNQFVHSAAARRLTARIVIRLFWNCFQDGAYFNINCADTCQRFVVKNGDVSPISSDQSTQTLGGCDVSLSEPEEEPRRRLTPLLPPDLCVWSLRRTDSFQSQRRVERLFSVWLETRLQSQSSTSCLMNPPTPICEVNLDTITR